MSDNPYTLTIEAVRLDYEDWAKKQQPWLLDKPKNDKDRLLQLTAWEAYQAGRSDRKE
jgi:hypothetical protein